MKHIPDSNHEFINKQINHPTPNILSNIYWRLSFIIGGQQPHTGKNLFGLGLKVASFL